MSDFAKAMGRRGGRARAKNLTVEQKKYIAAQGGKARAASLLFVERIKANFVYVELMQKLYPPPVVKRLKSCHHRLPGIYRNE